MTKAKNDPNDPSVPFSSYALLGSGRLARHLHYYLTSLNLPVRFWSRNADPAFNTYTDLNADTRLRRTLEGSSHVLLAVKDSSLADLAAGLPPGTVNVHFSGAMTITNAEGAHPLMTFSQQIETLEWYREIPFILEAKEGASLKKLLPGLPNRFYTLAPEERPYYHALCALAGNSAFLLWRKIGDEFERTLGLPRNLLSPYLHQVVANSSRFAQSGFTGPVARGDWAVVKAHLGTLLEHDKAELADSYQSYLSAARKAGYQVPEKLLPAQNSEVVAL